VSLHKWHALGVPCNIEGLLYKDTGKTLPSPKPPSADALLLAILPPSTLVAVVLVDKAMGKKSFP
jgi:hypothetical protein